MKKKLTLRLFFKNALLIVLLSRNSQCAASPYYFRSFKVENGLSNNSVTCVIQDKMGFLWVGTRDGLNRFDGYTFKIFRSRPEDNHSLKSNYILCIEESRKNRLWIGTDQGLYQYVPETESFHLIEQTSGMFIYDLKEDAQGNIWLLGGRSLYRLDIVTGILELVISKDNCRIYSIEKDSHGFIWVGTFSGYLYQFDSYKRLQKKIYLYAHDVAPENRNVTCLYAATKERMIAGTPDKWFKIVSIGEGTYENVRLPDIGHPNLYTRSIVQADDDKFWLGTEFGIFVYHLKSGYFETITKNYHDPYALKDNAIYVLYKDREGGVWIGTNLGGLNYLGKSRISFTKYYPEDRLSNIKGNVIRQIVKDSIGHFWIATEDAGINQFNPLTGKTRNYQSPPLSFSNVHSLMVAGSNLWVGTFHHGLDVMDIPSGQIVNRYNLKNKSGIVHNHISGIYQIKGAVFAVNPRGVFRLNRVIGKFEPFSGFPREIWYSCLYEDYDGTIWAGSYGRGLFYYDTEEEKTGAFRHQPSNNKSLTHDRINSIFQDSQCQLWITTDNGLCRFNRDNKSFDRFGKENGFSSAFMFSILEDAHQNLWISTSNGLSCFNPGSGKVVNYTTESGLLSNHFNHNSAFKDADGRMFFGSTEGVISFYPEQVKSDSSIPDVLLTGFKIDGTDYSKGLNHVLKDAIPFTKNIKLSSDQSTFSIEFASLKFNSSNILSYAYKMDGLSSSWVAANDNRRADFVGVPPGSYTFLVKAIRNDGTESQVSNIGIIISPPWWVSTPAYIGYGFLVLLSFLTILKINGRKIAEKNNRKIELIRISNEKDRLENQLMREKQLLEDKINFFTVIAHEIKTPLTLIKIPLAKIIKKTRDIPHIQRNLDTMSRNTNRLIELTNQLLDFRKVEMEKFRLTISEVSIPDLTMSVIENFTYLSEEKGIDLSCQLPDQTFYAHIDIDAFKTIIYNLVHNAIKYAKSHILISITPTPDFFSIVVQNDGPVIQEQYKEKIFEPFFRIDESNKETGSGIGLALSRSLAQLHNGSISLEAGDSGLNTFVLILPR